MDEARKGFSSFSGKGQHIDSLIQKKFMLYLDRDAINASLKALPAAPAAGTADPHMAERLRLTTSLTNCNAEITAADELIASHEKVIASQQAALLLPTFGIEEDVDNQRLRLQIPIFDPILNNPTIEDFWKKLIDYGEGLSWSEGAFKKALSNLLQYEAYKLYYNMRTKPLKDILAALQGSYFNYETVLDLQKKLDALTRQPNQSITNFMNNVHSLLYQTSAMRPGNETETKAVEKEILRQKLMMNASANARECLHKAIKKGMKRGEVFSYDTLLSIAREAEHEEGL